MKICIEVLEGAELDYAVALARRCHNVELVAAGCTVNNHLYSPSSSDECFKLIEKYNISVEVVPLTGELINCYYAWTLTYDPQTKWEEKDHGYFGDTYKMAAMRALVAKLLNDTHVKIPKRKK